MATYALKVAERLGGRRVLHRTVRSEFDLVRMVKEGLPAETVDHLVEERALSGEEVYRLIMPRRTLAHRKAKHQPLTLEESDRVARVARVIALAAETFQNEEKAGAWLRRPNRALGGTPPLELLDSDGGARLVEQVLGRIAYGIYS